jgi:pimeloyl-ACP methyl ester carboxylesterase
MATRSRARKATPANGPASVASSSKARRRLLARRRETDPFATEPYGAIRGDREYEVVSFDGAILPVEETGPASATSGAVFVHGLAMDRTSWHHQMANLDREHRYVFFDMRGHGHSTLGEAPLGVETFARDLEIVLERSGLERAALVGHSLGGMSILQFCAQFPDALAARGGPVRGVALLNTTGADVVKSFVAGAMLGPLPLRRRVARWLFSNPERLGFVRLGEGAGSRSVVRALGFSQGASAAQVAFACRLASAFPIERSCAILKDLLDLDVRDAMAAIDVPTLIVGSSRDRMVGLSASREMAAMIPGSRLVIFEGAGHATILERHGELTELLQEFLTTTLAEN